MESTPYGKIERRRIPELFNEWYWSCIGLYAKYKTFGLPFAGGWADQPAYVLDIIEAFLSADGVAVRDGVNVNRRTKNRD